MQQPYRAATGSPRGPGRHLIVTTAVLACLGSVLASAPAQASAGADDAGHAGSTGDDRVRASTPVELVPNGHFETGIEGWRVNDNTRQALDHVHPGQDSTGSVALTTSSPGKVILNDSVNTVRATTVGAVYEFSAWVRTPGAVTRHGLLRVREAADDVVVSSGRTRFAATTEWQQVTLAYTAASDASVLDLNVVAWRFKRGQSLQVDRVSMTTFEVDGRETCVSNAQGIPREGAYLGAAVSGASSLPVREDQYGTTLGLHRMFYTPAQIDKAINDATSDLANERMPWISFKLPYSWQDMADGRGDAWVHELTTRLAGIDGPVWVAFHREPEGDGPMAQWVRMQQHLSTLVHADTDNVAMTVIYSGYPLRADDLPAGRQVARLGVRRHPRLRCLQLLQRHDEHEDHRAQQEHRPV